MHFYENSCIGKNNVRNDISLQNSFLLFSNCLKIPLLTYEKSKTKRTLFLCFYDSLFCRKLKCRKMEWQIILLVMLSDLFQRNRKIWCLSAKNHLGFLLNSSIYVSIKFKQQNMLHSSMFWFFLKILLLCNKFKYFF